MPVAAASSAATATAATKPKGTAAITPKSSPTKKNKTTTKQKSGGTILEKIITAIRQEQKNPKGASRMAITKYLKSEWNCENRTAIQKALKQGVEKGQLIQEGQSFRVVGDKVPTVPNDEQLQIKILRKPTKETKNSKRTKRSNDKDDAPAAEAETEGDDETAISVVAQPGDSVVVKYQGKLVSDGTVFDAASSFAFVLGAGEVIKGWDQGIVGMSVGEVRQLIVPPKLGYGKRGALPEIPPNATLDFTVTLKQINSNRH